MSVPRPVRILLFLAAAGAVLWGSLAPASAAPSADLSDKAQHLIAYAVLGALGAWAFGPLLSVALALTAFGLSIEALQALMGLGREGDLADVAANTLGLAIGLGAAALLARLRR